MHCVLCERLNLYFAERSLLKLDRPWWWSTSVCIPLWNNYKKETVQWSEWHGQLRVWRKYVNKYNCKSQFCCTIFAQDGVILSVYKHVKWNTVWFVKIDYWYFIYLNPNEAKFSKIIIWWISQWDFKVSLEKMMNQDINV